MTAGERGQWRPTSTLPEVSAATHSLIVGHEIPDITFDRSTCAVCHEGWEAAGWALIATRPAESVATHNARPRQATANCWSGSGWLSAQRGWRVAGFVLRQTPPEPTASPLPATATHSRRDPQEIASRDVLISSLVDAGPVGAVDA